MCRRVADRATALKKSNDDTNSWNRVAPNSHWPNPTRETYVQRTGISLLLHAASQYLAFSKIVLYAFQLLGYDRNLRLSDRFGLLQ